MIRNWDKYRHQNITEGDCQLITAVNAYHYLTGRVVTDRRYERLIDLCSCRHGSAITIEKVWKDLGIREKERYQWIDLCRNREALLPLEVNVWHKFFGFHSVLVVESEPRTGAFRVTNLKHIASTDGWIFEEDLRPHMVLNSGREEPRWQYRSFELTTSRQ